MIARLAIVIPCHCRCDLLRDCLESVLAHAQPPTDILVIDDGSPDASVSRTVEEFHPVRCLRLSRRRGFCVAANRGIAATSAPFVETLNDDTRVSAGWSEAALRRFDNPAVAAVAPLVLRPDGRIDSAGDGYDRGGFARKLCHGWPASSAPSRPRPVFGASGSSAFFRRSTFERAGGFPELFGAYFDDVDLSFRLQRAGGRVEFEPASRVVHRGGSSYGRPSRRLVELQSCNEERVYWRNLPTRELLRTAPRHAAVLAAKALRRWNEGQLLPWSVGRARAWSELLLSRRHERRLNVLGPPRRLQEWSVGEFDAGDGIETGTD